MPLIAEEGVPVGAVCALGTSRNELDAGQVEALRELGAVASDLLHARRNASRLERALASAEQSRSAELTSRARLLRVLEHAPLGITVVSVDGLYVDANPAFAAMVGRSVDELVGVGSWEFTVPEDARQDAAATTRMLTDGKGVWRRQKRYLRPDGSHVRAIVTSCLIPAEDGGDPVWLSHIESVEQRRAAESRLLELQSAYDGIISTDDAGRVTAWNLGAERLLGHSAEVMLGHGLERILPPGQLWPYQDVVEHLGGGPTPREVDGTSRSRHRDRSAGRRRSPLCMPTAAAWRSSCRCPGGARTAATASPPCCATSPGVAATSCSRSSSAPPPARRTPQRASPTAPGPCWPTCAGDWAGSPAMPRQTTAPLSGPSARMPTRPAPGAS
jgi:PAS domain S-box-containing protein